MLSVVYISTALSLADKHFKPRPQNKFRTLYGFFTSSERCRDFSCSSDVGFVPTASSECLKENASSDVVAVSTSVTPALIFNFEGVPIRVGQPSHSMLVPSTKGVLSTFFRGQRSKVKVTVTERSKTYDPH